MRNKMQTAGSWPDPAVHLHHSTGLMVRSVSRSAAAAYKYSLLIATAILTVLVCLLIGIVKLSLKILLLPAMIAFGGAFLLYQYLKKKAL